MNTNGHEYLDKLAETVVGAAYEVSNVLGCGFLEKVYERALARELALRGVCIHGYAILKNGFQPFLGGNGSCSCPSRLDQPIYESKAR